MIPRRVSSQAETGIILASAIKAAQEAGGLRVGMVVGHPSVDEAAHLVALDGQEATLAWADGTKRTFPAGEVFDANRAYRIAMELGVMGASISATDEYAPPGGSDGG